MSDFLTAVSDVCGGFRALRPPKRVTVAEGAAKTLMIKRPGDAGTYWSAKRTPYMIEPMNMLASRRHAGLVFVGPAQSGKTVGLGEGWFSHVAVNDPGDMLIVQMTEQKAREYSRQRIDRALKHSPELAKLRTSAADNLHDKILKHGMMLKIAWPTVTNLSSTSYRYVFETDFDRMPEDIDGEGDAFTLGMKRTTTFLSRGMCAVESSPGFPLLDPKWRASTPHEAPPTKGILGIYNRSDRRRWYWKCPHCSEWFEAAPGLSLFRLPSDDELLEIVRESDLSALAAQYATVKCPHSGCIIEFSERKGMNEKGRWLQDGQRLTADDELVGTPMSSTIAGYWLGGVAAAYQTWESLITKHLQGLRDYALTGSELALQTAINTDQALPYISRHLVEGARGAGSPKDRAEPELKRHIVPDETRVLIASVDNQGGANARFVVQVHAIGPKLEQWLVDRYEITESKRPGMGKEFAPIDPANYAEDWDVLTERVVNSTYRTSVEGKELQVHLTVVDTGGEGKRRGGVSTATVEGVTEKAYAWLRRLRRLGLSDRVMLVKGVSTKPDWVIKLTHVGSRHGKETGDVPLWLLNPNGIKDAVSAGLKRTLPGPSYRHFPSWLPQSFFDELEAEVRGADGVWVQVRKRNESLDLCCYIHAGCLRLGLDKIQNWDAVPAWLQPLATNSGIMSREARREMKEVTAAHFTRERRRSTSSYLT